MANFSEMLGKLARKHGGKPSQPEAGSQQDLRPSRQVPVPESLRTAEGQDRPPGPLVDPTEQISKSVMSKIFQSVLDAAPEAPTSLGDLAAAAPRAAQPQRPPAAAPPPKESRSPAAQTPRPASREPVRGFRNHAELLKFASLIINDTEDLLRK